MEILAKYEVQDGRILTWSLEAHVVDHCNLRCRQCCTLSPDLPERVTPAEALARDLALAAEALRPHVFKITGGEPLLHPDLAACLEAARDSGISGLVQVTTNGFLIRRASPAFWKLVDRITLSLYSSAPLPDGLRRLVEEGCARHDVALNVKRVEEFAVMTPEPPWNAPETARAIHEKCWLKVRCHLLHSGLFFKCTRPPHLETYLERTDVRRLAAGEDGVALEGPALGPRLKAYLESEDPLASCAFCMGASGGFIPHGQR